MRAIDWVINRGIFLRQEEMDLRFLQRSPTHISVERSVSQFDSLELGKAPLVFQEAGLSLDEAEEVCPTIQIRISQLRYVVLPVADWADGVRSRGFEKHDEPTTWAWVAHRIEFNLHQDDSRKGL